MGDLHESIPEGVVSLPVIDLSLDRDQVSRAILDAGKNIGFFQASPNILACIFYHGFVMIVLPATAPRYQKV
jgi:hypothetical protein